MDGIVIISWIVGLVFFPLLLGLFFYRYTKKRSKATQNILSDAELFKLMMQANHFLSAKQLSATSSLSERDAQYRLEYLAIRGIIKRYADKETGQLSVFQLQDDVLLINSLPASIDGLNEEEIVDLLLMHVADYSISIPELVVIFGITVEEAQYVLKRLEKSGLVTKLRQGLRAVYVIKKPIQARYPETGNKVQIQDMKMKIPEVEKIKIPDADVLQAAIKNKGKLTTTGLCLELKIPLDVAKAKLECLHEQGAFTIDVDSHNSMLEYKLVDELLLG